MICRDGRERSHGVAAWLRARGTDAERPMIPFDKLRNRDRQGCMVWVTRSRPKVDRIACPWLIRRFVDPETVFLFVPPSEVAAVASRFDGEAFDVDGQGVFWSHRGDLCTFDVMIAELGLANLAVWFAVHTVFAEVRPVAAGPFRFDVPVR